MRQVINTSPLGQLATPTFGGGVITGKKGRQTTAGAGKLNLVSLMDIFTILVFFLMLNSGDVEVLQPDAKVELPKSYATLKPSDVPVIKITADAILFRDVMVASLDDLEKGKSLPELEVALNAFTEEQASRFSNDDALINRGVSIMSDASTSYATLKRVLFASAQAGYRDIGLATEFGGQRSSATQVGS